MRTRQGWRTIRQRTAWFQVMRRGQRKGGLKFRNWSAARRVGAMLKRVGLT